MANISDRSAPPLAMLLNEGASWFARAYSAFGHVGERGPADGVPVMVIPGFLGTDRATLGLQRAIADAGYRVIGWGMGWNRGAQADTLDRLIAGIAAFGKGRPVVLVGWSLGGIFAREAAKARPDLIAKVVTMGTPFSGSMRANHAWRLYELVAGHSVDAPPIKGDFGAKPPVPTIALWSRRDGIVAPASARGTKAQSDRQIELACTHMGFAVDPQAFPQIIDAIQD